MTMRRHLLVTAFVAGVLFYEAVKFVTLGQF